MHSNSDEEAVRASADLLVAIFFVGLGIAIVYMSWTMDRLEIRRIHPSTIPGLVPLILGGALTLCGTLLAVRSARLSRPGAWAALGRTLLSKQALKAASVLGLALVYTLVLVGSMPFWLASALFIVAFIMLFETVLSDAPRTIIRTIFWALTVALIGGFGVYFLFERIFLVRLP